MEGECEGTENLSGSGGGEPEGEVEGHWWGLEGWPRRETEGEVECKIEDEVEGLQFSLGFQHSRFFMHLYQFEDHV